jgi:hypothetical protein
MSSDAAEIWYSAFEIRNQIIEIPKASARSGSANPSPT